MEERRRGKGSEKERRVLFFSTATADVSLLLPFSRESSISPLRFRLTEEDDRVGSYGSAEVPLLLGTRHRESKKKQRS